MILAVLALTFLTGGVTGGGKESCLCNPHECNQPVCGSDLVTYKCMCELNCHNNYADPLHKVHKVYEGRCAPNCGCKPDPKGPLCANDLKTYESECVLNCNHPHLLPMYPGVCLD